MREAAKKFRILLIEDDVMRINLFRSWMPADVSLVVTSSAGVAMGVLERDDNRKYGRIYSGILLDHDLQEQTITNTDRYLSGSNLIEVIIRNIYKDVPILIHSMNPRQSFSMQQKLQSAGYVVTKIPMSVLTQADFNRWLKESYELWQDICEDQQL